MREPYFRAGLDKAEANHRATLTYTSYVGYWRIHGSLPPARPDELASYVDHLKATLIPAAEERP